MTSSSAYYRHRWGRRGAPLVALVLALVLLGTGLLAGPASAANGSIDLVESKAGKLQALFSVPGASGKRSPDLSSVSATLDGAPVDAKAELAVDSKQVVRRTAVLAIDVSNSMRRDGKFVEAKAAATAFLDAAPDDLYVGVVTFAGTVEVAQRPTLDRALSASVIDGLTLGSGTRLYEGVSAAVAATGTEGQRSVLVLSDGRDTSGEPVAGVTADISQAEAIVDVVALAQSGADEALLAEMADAGGGDVIAADDPAALSRVFAGEAQVLARQLLVSVDLPADADQEGTLEISVAAGAETHTDSAFVTIAAAKDPSVIGPSVDLAPAQISSGLPRTAMYGGIAALAVGSLVVLLFLMGVFSGAPRPASVENRVQPYTRRGGGEPSPAQRGEPQSMGQQAVGIAQKALESNKGFEKTLGGRLDAAGLSIRPSEWLLMHTGIAFLVALGALLISSGSILFALLGLVLGIIGPWLYLGFKRGRRLKAFRSQLADTLQLMSGSLSAGLSLAQSIDTVVREGADPMANELRRALVEARLGVEIEDALESIAGRMQSKDFEWVVMAIRIQREVGGNLAELLNTVAATIREREYLARQVLAFSAEGRLSVWLLGGLPPGFMAYLLVANPGYLEPLFSTTLGYLMLSVMAVLLTVGIFWMKKLVKVEV